MSTALVVAMLALALLVGGVSGYAIGKSKPEDSELAQLTRETRRAVKSAYLTAAVSFLHAIAIKDARISIGGYPKSRYTLMGVPVTIDARPLRSFIQELDKQRGNPYVKLARWRERIIRKSIQLALQQARINEFGWSDD